MADLVATIDQGAADKIISAATYPLRVFTHDQPFPRLLLDEDEGQADVPFDMILDIVQSMPGSSQPASPSAPQSPEAVAEHELRTQIAASASALFDAARAVIPAADDPAYDPEKARKIREFADRGLAGMHDLVFANARGWPKWRVHLRRASVTLLQAPTVSLAVPSTSASGVRTAVRVTGELWFYGPRPTWDWPWNWPIEWQLWASATVGLGVDARAHVDLRTDGHLVKARGVTDEIRLRVPILDLINLAGLANRYLAQQAQVVYDTRKLVVAVPLMDEKFHIAAVTLPHAQGRVTVEVNVGKV